ncbi:sulfatase family protein [Pontiella desulfatans]|nr:sulfatase-like hydrolase/transferase [Pontiella desulfatans]
MDKTGMIKLKQWVLGIGAVWVAGSALAAQQPLRQAQDRPNIVLVMADDMGWGDVGYHGYDDVMTPNIDRIAKEGVQFTQGYVTASVCGPSRAGLLTGVYQQKFGCGENPSSSGWPDNCKYPMAGVPTSQPMISELLKEQGYTTGMVGKWHLGVHEDLRPHSRGFDFYYGFLNGSHSYEEWTNEFAKNKSKWPIFRNNEMEPPQKDIYLTDLFSDEAVGFIDRNHDKPFFLYMAYNAIHHPWEVPAEYAERTKDLTNSENRNFIAAMILAMDDGVGRVYDELEKHKILDNTVIVFLTDNGSPRGQGLKHAPKDNLLERMDGMDYMSLTPYRGFKGDTYEGGIRVPFCMRWPGQINPGTKYEFPVSALDLVPTFVKGAKSDGVDLLPYIQGSKKGRPHDMMYWRRDTEYAIRKGDWKLTWNTKSGTPSIKLFNLAEDPEERVNLAKSQPERAQILQRLFEEWDNELPDNEWWGGPWNRKRHSGAIDVAEFNQNLPAANQLRKKIRK